MKQLFLFFALLATTFSSAQLFDDLANLLKASEEDYNILADAYTAPLGQSLTHSLSNGWLTTAKTGCIKGSIGYLFFFCRRGSFTLNTLFN